jgi:hypothetical protein
MDQFEAAEAMGLLSMLFEAFPSSGDKNSETTAKAYLLAIEGCTIRGLREGVRRLIRGEVPEHNGKFIPPTAILARVVKYEDDRIRIEAAYAGRKRIERANYDNVVQLDPETRARRIEQLKELTAKLQRI